MPHWIPESRAFKRKHTCHNVNSVIEGTAHINCQWCSVHCSALSSMSHCKRWTGGHAPLAKVTFKCSWTSPHESSNLLKVSLFFWITLMANAVTSCRDNRGIMWQCAAFACSPWLNPIKRPFSCSSGSSGTSSLSVAASQSAAFSPHFLLRLCWKC